MRISDWSSDVCSSDLPVRSVHGNPDPSTHGDTVDQRDIGLGIPLDEGVEAVFITVEGDQIGLAASLPQTIERADVAAGAERPLAGRSEEHTSELQSLMRISYAVFCLKKKKLKITHLN